MPGHDRFFYKKKKLPIFPQIPNLPRSLFLPHFFSSSSASQRHHPPSDSPPHLHHPKLTVTQLSPTTMPLPTNVLYFFLLSLLRPSFSFSLFSPPIPPPSASPLFLLSLWQPATTNFLFLLLLFPFFLLFFLFLLCLDFEH